MLFILSSLYILHIRPSSDVELVKIFSYSLGWYFVLMMVSFALENLFSFMRYTVDLSAYAIDILFRKLSPMPMHARLFPIFSSIRFSVSSFILSSLIHWELTFLQGDRYMYPLNSSTCRHPVRAAPFVLKMLAGFHCQFQASLSQISCPYVWRFKYGSSIRFHWVACLFLCQYYAVFSTMLL